LEERSRNRKKDPHLKLIVKPGTRAQSLPTWYHPVSVLSKQLRSTLHFGGITAANRRELRPFPVETVPPRNSEASSEAPVPVRSTHRLSATGIDSYYSSSQSILFFYYIFIVDVKHIDAFSVPDPLDHPRPSRDRQTDKVLLVYDLHIRIEPGQTKGPRDHE
jgi:hypothetical protein